MTKKYFNTKYFFLFISPWLIGFTLFTLGPILSSLYLSFTKYSIVEAPRWVGMLNYKAIFKGFEPNFFNSVKVTVLFTMLAVPLNIIIALAAALLLNVKNIRGMTFFRTVFFLPALIPVVATALAWSWVFHPKYGVLNLLYLKLFGEQGPNWLQSPPLVLGCIVVITIWAFGNTMMIFLAGLQGVPKGLLDAATIDGASGWQRFRNVTVPYISPVIFFNVIIGIIGAFQVFTQAFIFTELNRAGVSVNNKAVHFYVLNIYQQAFENGQFGLACALAWILLLVILVMTLIQFYFKKKWVFYNE
jgi:multiple sugar transport system permease protein